MSRIASLVRDERGASIIEMGMALPVLGFMLIGIVDLSNGYAAKLRLEQAAQSTIEAVQQQGYAHDTTSNPTSLQRIETEAETRAGTGADATASVYRECDAGTTTTQVALTATCPGTQPSARYVSVTITQTYEPLFGFEFAGADANGNYLLTGQAALRFQ